MNGPQVLKRTVPTLPKTPGVYRMLDASGNVLYVGKAKSLRKRVASYTQTDRLSARIAQMVLQTAKLEIIEAGSEAEAFLIENDLIKTLKPKYNILLRDDKSFPFIAFTKDDYPRVFKKRGRIGDAELFGPFSDIGALHQTLTFLEKTFLLRSCSDNVFKTRQRPCILYQIKRCSAPCRNLIPKNDYKTLIHEAKDFLRGKSDNLKLSLEQRMQEESVKQNYLAAAIYRDRLKALNSILHQTFSDIKTLPDTDVFGITSDKGAVAIYVSFVRLGQNAGSASFFFEGFLPDEEILSSFIGQFYQKYPLPKEILVSLPVDEAIEEAFNVPVRRNVRGGRKMLLDRTVSNARTALARHLTENTKDAEGLLLLSKLLERDISIIEAYDNSHLFGTHPVGVAVQATPEGFNKNGYRKFNIRGEAGAKGDDPHMMREVLSRRFKYTPPPDVILIDGGRGQLSVISDILPPEVTVISIAKGEKRNDGLESFYRVEADGKITPLDIPFNTPLRFYLQRLRDESHRFAIGSHRVRRKQGMFSSPLDNVPGIGARKKAALLKHFGSARAIGSATILELQKVPGINAALAQKIIDNL